MATLYLGDNKIGDEGAKTIGASDSLTTLSVNGNKFGDEGAKALVAGVAASGSMALLNLNRNKIGDAAKKWLRDAVQGRHGQGFQLYV